MNVLWQLQFDIRIRMNPKYQIFISSTFKDLVEHRNSVVETALRMSHLLVNMEVFNSAAKIPRDVIKNHIHQSFLGAKIDLFSGYLC